MAPGIGQVWTSVLSGPDATSYSRNLGGGFISIPLRGRYLLAQSAERWVVFAQSGSNLSRGHYIRVCTPPPTYQYNYANNLRIDLKSPDANLSFAVTETSHSLVVFQNTADTRMEVCYPCLVNAAGTTVCPGENLRATAGVRLHVAPMHSGELVLGVRHNAASDLLELVERDLSDCSSAWNLLGTAPASDGATSGRPVRFGLAPGMLYVRNGGLYAYRP